MPLYELHESEKQILESVFGQFLQQICQDSAYKILVPATNEWSTAYHRPPTLEEFFAHIGGQQNFPGYLRSLPYERYKRILESVARITIIDSFDAILFPKEIYDFPEQIAKVDTDALLNKIYGVNCAIQHAVGHFWEILENSFLPQTPEQKLALLEQVNELLVDDGLFPSKPGHWDRDYIAIYNMTRDVREESHPGDTTQELPRSVGHIVQGSKKRAYGSSEHFRKLKRSRLDIGIIWSDIDQQSFLSLLKQYLENPTVASFSSTENSNRGKYHSAIKLIATSRFAGSSELEHYETTRRLFLHLPRILNTMLELAANRELVFNGKKYFRGLRFDGSGELDLLLELINQARTTQVATTPYFTVALERERAQTFSRIAGLIDMPLADGESARLDRPVSGPS